VGNKLQKCLMLQCANEGVPSADQDFFLCDECAVRFQQLLSEQAEGEGAQA
jgi:hypothetical protein